MKKYFASRVHEANSSDTDDQLFYSVSDVDARIAELERRLYDAESTIMLRHDAAVVAYVEKYPEPVNCLDSP